MEIQEKKSLKEYSTYKIGGKADYFCVIKQKNDIAEAIDFAKRNSFKIFFLGGGSNVLFSDKGFPGVIAKIENNLLEIVENCDKHVKIRCGAGVELSKLGSLCVQKGLTGFEWAAGIPGTIGGAVRGNAGAYGGEMKDCVLKIFAIDKGDENLEVQEIDVRECEFEYRSSTFKNNPNLLVWEIELELKKGASDEVKAKTREVFQKRNEGQPSVGKFPSVGCMFKNPTVSQEVVDNFEFDREQKSRGDKVPAGWLIDRCDLKGERIGGAMIDHKQANFIVNMGDATSEDVLILMSLIKMKVRNKFKVQLEEEVKIVM